MIDGSSLSLYDSEENREKYPYHRNQKADVGYPLARVSIMTSLETGSLVDFAMGPFAGKGNGELGLSKNFVKYLDSNDVVIADAMFHSYFFISLVMKKKANMVTICKGTRKFNVIESKKIGPADRLITIQKPRVPHTGWLESKDFERTPKTIKLRESIITVKRKGFRDMKVKLISTLTDFKKYKKKDIANLYLKRWNIELDFRILKRDLGLEYLKCKSPNMVEKEIWAHFIVYNLVRRTMLTSSKKAGIQPREISFKLALQIYSSMRSPINPLDNHSQRTYENLLNDCLASKPIPKRPGRHEPRARKKRLNDNDYPYLKTSRKDWKKDNLHLFAS